MSKPKPMQPERVALVRSERRLTWGLQRELLADRDYQESRVAHLLGGLSWDAAR